MTFKLATTPHHTDFNNKKTHNSLQAMEESINCTTVQLRKLRLIYLQDDKGKQIL